MVQKNNRPTVKDMLDMKVRGQKISMIYVTTLEEAAAANIAGIDMLSIEAKYFSPEMREAAGRCFVQVVCPTAPPAPAPLNIALSKLVELTLVAFDGEGGAIEGPSRRGEAAQHRAPFDCRRFG